MLRRILTIVLILPVSILLVMLAVANRHPVALVLDPFAGTLSAELPLFAVVLGSVILGVVLGGGAVWVRQGRYRKAARHAGREAKRANAQVDGLRAALSERERAAGERLPRGLAAPAGATGPALADRRDAA